MADHHGMPRAGDKSPIEVSGRRNAVGQTGHRDKGFEASAGWSRKAGRRLEKEICMELLDDKTAVITGASSGIGLATATRFIDEGARVFITGRRQAELDAALSRLGKRATGVCGDVGVGADLDRLYAAVTESGRGLDVVMANAGIPGVAQIGQITEEHVDALVSTNIKGVIFTVQKALPLLNDGASIILTGVDHCRSWARRTSGFMPPPRPRFGHSPVLGPTSSRAAGSAST
jgi:hypothetical protein